MMLRIQRLCQMGRTQRWASAMPRLSPLKKIGRPPKVPSPNASPAYYVQPVVPGAKPLFLAKNAVILGDSEALISQLATTTGSDPNSSVNLLKEMTSGELVASANLLVSAAAASPSPLLVSLVENTLVELSGRKDGTGVPLEVAPALLKVKGQLSSSGSMQVWKDTQKALSESPSPAHSMQLLEALLQTLCSPLHNNQLQSGLWILSELEARNMQPTKGMMMTLMETAGRKGDTGKVMELYKKIEAGDYDFPICRDIVLAAAKGFALDGDILTTRFLLDVISVRNLEPSIPDAYPFAIRSLALAQRGNLSEAVEEFNKIHRNGLPMIPLALEGLMEGFKRSKNMAGIVRYYHFGDAYHAKPTLQMHLTLVRGHFAVNEPVAGWRRVKAVLEALHPIRKQPFHCPPALLTLLASDIQGKHLDYTLDHLSMAKFNPDWIPALLLGLMETLVTRGHQMDGPLVERLSVLFTDTKSHSLFTPTVAHSQHARVLSIAALNAQGNHSAATELMNVFGTDALVDSKAKELMGLVFPGLVSGALKGKNEKSAMEWYEKALGFRPTPALFEAMLALGKDILSKDTLDAIPGQALEHGCLPSPVTEPTLYNAFRRDKLFVQF